MDGYFGGYATVGLLILVGVAFVAVALSANRLLRPYRPSREKLTTYECGVDPVGGAAEWIVTAAGSGVVGLLVGAALIPIVGYVLTQGGLMVDASLSGTKITKPMMNAARSSDAAAGCGRGVLDVPRRRSRRAARWTSGWASATASGQPTSAIGPRSLMSLPR